MGRCEAVCGALSCNDDGSGRFRTAAKGALCTTFSRTECQRRSGPQLVSPGTLVSDQWHSQVPLGESSSSELSPTEPAVGDLSSANASTLLPDPAGPPPALSAAVDSSRFRSRAPRVFGWYIETRRATKTTKKIWPVNASSTAMVRGRPIAGERSPYPT